MKFINDKSTLSDEQLFKYWEDLTRFSMKVWHGSALEEFTREQILNHVNILENVISNSCNWCSCRVQIYNKQCGFHCLKCNMFFCDRCKDKTYLNRVAVDTEGEAGCLICNPNDEELLVKA